MSKKDFIQAQKIIDSLFYNDKALTQWQYELLENVISVATTKLAKSTIKNDEEMRLKKEDYTHEELVQMGFVIQKGGDGRWFDYYHPSGAKMYFTLGGGRGTKSDWHLLPNTKSE